MKLDFDEIPDPESRYDLGELLGCGVYGKVYSADDSEVSQKKVAIKLQKYDDETKVYIDEEYAILKDLSAHPNIIDFYGVYKQTNEIWFVLEICEGTVMDLINDLLSKNRRMSEEHIAYILKEVVKGLIHLHENNVIHRDIKGSNILITREGEVKLCDFGLSQTMKSQDERFTARLGSPSWMAPELVSANPKQKDACYDQRVDIWSLGITAIEIGEGIAPFQNMHPARALFQIVRNPPPAFKKLSHWTENYHDFVSECLVKEYEYRPYIVEIIGHPFLEQVPENNYHLCMEVKSMLLEIEKGDPLQRLSDANVNGKFIKKNIDGNIEPLLEDDLAAFPAISEKNILMLLELRTKMGDCYTYLGDILLYLNPNEKRNIYGPEFHQKYQCKSRSDNAPHIYAVADTAYQNAIHHMIPQQIVLSGESGSGKTSNYLHLVDHLFYLGPNPSINVDRIKNSIKVIHSLLHASTPTNIYSTRAVFKTTITYGNTGKLSGANFKVHCLEKWRVSATDLTQSNFHIFYYIYDGLLAMGGCDRYKLNEERDYRYMRIEEESKPNQPKDDLQRNVVKYKMILNYLRELEFSKHQIDTIHYIIAAILHLGEARFQQNEDRLAVLENKESIEIFSELLEIDEKKLKWSLTNYCLIRDGNVIRKRNSCDEARDTRDVLANNLYVRMVDYIVHSINSELFMGSAIFGEKYAIKLLDYFGFECFKKNSFSQFIVNCLNEQFHYHFLQRNFSWEIFDLENEELEYRPVNFYNNKDTLNELLGKPDGVLSVIDEASKKGCSGRYLIANIHNQDKSKVIVADAMDFTVAHYTGKVTYNAKDMPDKNRDYLPPEIIETLRASHNPIISMLFTNKLDKMGNLSISMQEIKGNKLNKLSNRSCNNNQFSQVRRMRTQATIFRSLCLEMLMELSVGSGSGGTHFVRCIRTDLKGKPQNFHKELIRQQLRALSVVETTKARQQGYPSRIPFSEFLRRYKFLAFDFDENVEVTRDSCRLLMVRLKMEGWALGKSKIFLKYYNEEYLSRLYETQVNKIIKIQCILRGFLVKCRLKKQAKKQEENCIKEIKNQRRRSSILTEDEAAEIIQKAYRKTARRKEVLDIYEPLDKEEQKLIKPFVKKWRNQSIFSVLLRYRAIKMQEFTSFAHQVHLYNMNAFHCCQELVEPVDLANVDVKANTFAWLFQRPISVLKLRFRLDEIPFYDTSHMRDLLTNLGNFSDIEENWDLPYRWRETLSKKYSLADESKLKKESPIEDLVNMNYIRDPDQPICQLSTPVDEHEESTKDDKQTENEFLKKNTGRSYQTNKKPIAPNRTYGNNEPTIEKINLKKVGFPEERESFITNFIPANNDFEYKAKPVMERPKNSPDPLAELKKIVRRDSKASDDDPPFNFQGMLRKTDFRRPSLKNTIDAVRRFSITTDQDKNLINGNVKKEPIIGKSVTLEILPGLIMEGLEVEL